MDKTTTRTRPAPVTAIEGVTYLLGRAVGYADWVSRYTDDDMAELFTPADRATLAGGETIALPARGGDVFWTDMVAVARAAAA